MPTRIRPEVAFGEARRPVGHILQRIGKRRAVTTATTVPAVMDRSTSTPTAITACFCWVRRFSDGTSRRNEPDVPIASDSTSAFLTVASPTSTRAAPSTTVGYTTTRRPSFGGENLERICVQRTFDESVRPPLLRDDLSGHPVEAHPEITSRHVLHPEPRRVDQRNPQQQRRHDHDSENRLQYATPHAGSS